MKIPNSYGEQIFVFSVEVFHFLKIQESEVKHDKRDFKRGLRLTFEVKCL